MNKKLNRKKILNYIYKYALDFNFTTIEALVEHGLSQTHQVDKVLSLRAAQSWLNQNMLLGKVSNEDLKRSIEIINKLKNDIKIKFPTGSSAAKPSAAGKPPVSTKPSTSAITTRPDTTTAITRTTPGTQDLSVAVKEGPSSGAASAGKGLTSNLEKLRKPGLIASFVTGLVGGTWALSKLWASGQTIYQNAINARTVLEQTGSLKSVIEPADYSNLINLFQTQSALGNAMRGLQSQFGKLRSYDMASASPESFDKDMVALEILLASFRDKRKQYNQIAGQNYLSGFASKYGVKRTIDPRNLMAIQDIKAQGGRADQQIKESLNQIASTNFEQEVDSILARYKQLKGASSATPAPQPATPPRPRITPRPTAPGPRRPEPVATSSPQPAQPAQSAEAEPSEGPASASNPEEDSAKQDIMRQLKSLQSKASRYADIANKAYQSREAYQAISNIWGNINSAVTNLKEDSGTLGQSRISLISLTSELNDAIDRLNLKEHDPLESERMEWNGPGTDKEGSNYLKDMIKLSNLFGNKYY